jgi:hypothetical protein
MSYVSHVFNRNVVNFIIKFGRDEEAGHKDLKETVVFLAKGEISLIRFGQNQSEELNGVEEDIFCDKSLHK